MPIQPLYMAECERVRPSGNICRIRTSFAGIDGEIPKGWRRDEGGTLLCDVCVRETGEPDTKPTRRP